MQIAVLGDIHGNLPALRAVLAELDTVEPEAIVVLGDTAGGPLVRECLELIDARPEPIHWVAGNGEREAVAARDDPDPAGDGKHDQMAAWTAAHLDQAWRDRMASWTDTLVLEGVYLCHASPRADDENLTRITPDAVIAEAFIGIDAPLLIDAHTHQQFIRSLPDGRIFANCGSIGIPYEDRAGAFWLLVTDGQPELRETPYDVGAAIDELRASGFPAVDDVFGDALVTPVSAAWVTTYFEHLAGRGEHPGDPA